MVDKGYGPIPLGRKGRPIDTTAWDERCMKTLGRKIPLGAQISKDESVALGFRATVLGEKKAGY